MQSKSLRIKLITIGIFLSMAYFALAGQLVRIQILDHEKYSEIAQAQHNKKIELPPSRGPILDRNGRKLAESFTLCSIFADPSQIEERPRTAYLLARTLGLDASQTLELLENKKDKKFVWIKRKVSNSEAVAVKRLDLKGVDCKEEIKRFYPNGTLCSNVLGFVDIDGKGLEGIEFTCDKILTGKSGYMLLQKDASQRYISTPGAEIVPPKHGHGVMLTIDAVIQTIVEDELRKAYDTHKPISAVAIAMDPSTGEILAMSTVPSYNPNYFWKYPPDARRNRAVTDCYEPGSILKPIVVSGVFEYGLAAPDDEFFCHNGVYKIGKRTLHDTHEYGRLTVANILVKSSNIGMAKLGMLMGKERLYHHLHKFGFGEKTKVRLPGENSGIVRPLSVWSYYSETSVPMGHEIAVTPLQMINAFCAIANGGELLRPRVIRAITDNDGKRIEKRFAASVKRRRVIDLAVANDTMTPILSMVVKAGTGRKADMSAYNVAGKTGTAQKLQPDGRGYSSTKYISSFIGYAPVDNPKICVLVTLDEPRNGSYYGGTVAAPVVREIIRKTLFYMGVEPQEALPPVS